MDVSNVSDQPEPVGDVTAASGNAASRTPRKKFVGKRTAEALAAARKQQENGTNDSVEDTNILIHNGKQRTLFR